jgi:hypothetical protein
MVNLIPTCIVSSKKLFQDDSSQFWKTMYSREANVSFCTSSHKAKNQWWPVYTGFTVFLATTTKTNTSGNTFFNTDIILIVGRFIQCLLSDYRISGFFTEAKFHDFLPNWWIFLAVYLIFAKNWTLIDFKIIFWKTVALCEIHREN